MRHIGIGPARTLAEDGNFDASLVCYPSEDIAFRRGLRTWATGKMEGRIQPLSHGGSGTLFKIWAKQVDCGSSSNSLFVPVSLRVLPKSENTSRNWPLKCFSDICLLFPLCFNNCWGTQRHVRLALCKQKGHLAKELVDGCVCGRVVGISLFGFLCFFMLRPSKSIKQMLVPVRNLFLP